MKLANDFKFRFGRLSAAKYDCFSINQLMIYEMMTAPYPKEGTIVGWNKAIEDYYGRKPDPYISLLSEEAVDYRSHFIDWDAFIMSGAPSSDIPTEGLSSMLYGAILIVDRIPSWQSLVVDGVTGWLCTNEREFVYKASRCAHEENEREQMKLAAYELLFERFSSHPHLKSLLELEATL